MMQSENEVAAPEILVVDDESSVRHVLRTVLERKGCNVQTAGSAEEAISLLKNGFVPHVALLDIVLPGMNGLELLSEIVQRYPDTQAVLITSHGSVDTAIGAIRRGAYDYLQKPFPNLEHIWNTVQRALEKRRLTLQLRCLRGEQAARGAEISRAAGRLSGGDVGLPEAGEVVDEAPPELEPVTVTGDDERS